VAAADLPCRVDVRGGALLLVGGLIVYGSFRLVHPPFEPGPTVAVLQDNLPHKRLMADGPLVFSRYDHLTRAAVKGGTTPDLVVWPEACYFLRDISFAAATPAEREAMIRALPEDWPHGLSFGVQETSEKAPILAPDWVANLEREDREGRKKDWEASPPEERGKLEYPTGYYDLLRAGRKDHARTRWQRDPANPQTCVLLGGRPSTGTARARRGPTPPG
jgi:hypothetical protein